MYNGKLDGGKLENNNIIFDKIKYNMVCFKKLNHSFIQNISHHLIILHN